MPLKFNGLNVFIGENDSGKTSLFEVLQILSRELAVDESMFFDKRKKIKFRARYRNIDEKTIDKISSIDQWDLDYYKCISNTSRNIDPGSEDFDCKGSMIIIKEHGGL